MLEDSQVSATRIRAPLSAKTRIAVAHGWSSGGTEQMAEVVRIPAFQLEQDLHIKTEFVGDHRLTRAIISN